MAQYGMDRNGCDWNAIDDRHFFKYRKTRGEHVCNSAATWRSAKWIETDAVERDRRRGRFADTFSFQIPDSRAASNVCVALGAGVFRRKRTRLCRCVVLKFFLDN